MDMRSETLLVQQLVGSGFVACLHGISVAKPCPPRYRHHPCACSNSY